MLTPGRSGSNGKVFEDTLKELIEDRWTASDMRHAAHNALSKIEGRD